MVNHALSSFSHVIPELVWARGILSMVVQRIPVVIGLGLNLQKNANLIINKWELQESKLSLENGDIIETSKANKKKSDI